MGSPSCACTGWGYASCGDARCAGSGAGQRGSRRACLASATGRASCSGPVDSYAWGGLNGRGFSAALWLLALPFAMVNLAGWMAPVKDSGAFRGAVRFAGLCVTALYVLGSAAAAMDLSAYQCAGGSELGRFGRRAAASWWVIGVGGPLATRSSGCWWVRWFRSPWSSCCGGWTYCSRQAYECWDATWGRGPGIRPPATRDVGWMARLRWG